MSASPLSLSRMRLYAGAFSANNCSPGAFSAIAFSVTSCPVPALSPVGCFASVSAILLIPVEAARSGRLTALFAGLAHLRHHLGCKIVFALLDALTHHVQREGRH